MTAEEKFILEIRNLNHKFIIYLIITATTIMNSFLNESYTCTYTHESNFQIYKISYSK